MGFIVLVVRQVYGSSELAAPHVRHPAANSRGAIPGLFLGATELQRDPTLCDYICGNPICEWIIERIKFNDECRAWTRHKKAPSKKWLTLHGHACINLNSRTQRQRNFGQLRFPTNADVQRDRGLTYPRGEWLVFINDLPQATRWDSNPACPFDVFRPICPLHGFRLPL